jgi:hypothetical protein
MSEGIMAGAVVGVGKVDGSDARKGAGALELKTGAKRPALLLLQAATDEKVGAWTGADEGNAESLVLLGERILEWEVMGVSS